MRIYWYGFQKNWRKICFQEVLQIYTAAFNNASISDKMFQYEISKNAMNHVTSKAHTHNKKPPQM